jgi:hypothetical protein
MTSTEYLEYLAALRMELPLDYKAPQVKPSK